MGAFPYFKEDCLYFYWYWSEINAYLLAEFPKTIEDELPIWYEVCSDGDIQLSSGLLCSRYLEGYRYKDGEWLTNIAPLDKALEDAPQILYSDIDIYKLEDGKYTMVYDGEYDFSPATDTDSNTDDDEQSLLERIISAILSLPSKLIDGLMNLLKTLFVPSYNPMTELLELLNEKIPIAMQLYAIIHNFISKLGDFDYSDYTCEITLNLGGLFGLDGSYNVFDFSWYLPYRNIVNCILTGFIYLWFIFSTFKNLSKTIRGL